MKRIILAALVGVLVCGGIAFIFNPGIVSAQSAFDSCMRKYSPTPGPNYGFMAAQSACHAATRAPSKNINVLPFVSPVLVKKFGHQSSTI